MNFVKLLTVPAVLLLSGLMAVPAFGQTPSATISNLTASCNSDHKVCFDFDVTTADFAPSGQDVAVDLINANTGTVHDQHDDGAVDHHHHDHHNDALRIAQPSIPRADPLAARLGTAAR